jgi:hypothetical protein
VGVTVVVTLFWDVYKDVFITIFESKLGVEKHFIGCLTSFCDAVDFLDDMCSCAGFTSFFNVIGTHGVIDVMFWVVRLEVAVAKRLGTLFGCEGT